MTSDVRFLHPELAVVHDADYRRGDPRPPCAVATALGHSGPCSPKAQLTVAYPMSFGVRNGQCGLTLSSEEVCDLPRTHYGPHRFHFARGPQWVAGDSWGRELGRYASGGPAWGEWSAAWSVEYPELLKANADALAGVEPAEVLLAKAPQPDLDILGPSWHRERPASRLARFLGKRRKDFEADYPAAGMVWPSVNDLPRVGWEDAETERLRDRKRLMEGSTTIDRVRAERGYPKFTLLDDPALLDSERALVRMQAEQRDAQLRALVAEAVHQYRADRPQAVLQLDSGDTAVELTLVEVDALHDFVGLGSDWRASKSRRDLLELVGRGGIRVIDVPEVVVLEDQPDAKPDPEDAAARPGPASWFGTIRADASLPRNVIEVVDSNGRPHRFELDLETETATPLPDVPMPVSAGDPQAQGRYPTRSLGGTQIVLCDDTGCLRPVLRGWKVCPDHLPTHEAVHAAGVERGRHLAAMNHRKALADAMGSRPGDVMDPMPELLEAVRMLVAGNGSLAEERVKAHAHTWDIAARDVQGALGDRPTSDREPRAWPDLMNRVAAVVARDAAAVLADREADYLTRRQLADALGESEARLWLPQLASVSKLVADDAANRLALQAVLWPDVEPSLEDGPEWAQLLDEVRDRGQVLESKTAMLKDRRAEVDGILNQLVPSGDSWAALMRQLAERCQSADVRAHRAAKAELAVDALAEAVRLTVEYVGVRHLPPLPGWSWYEALLAHRPELLSPFIEQWNRQDQGGLPTAPGVADAVAHVRAGGRLADLQEPVPGVPAVDGNRPRCPHRYVHHRYDEVRCVLPEGHGDDHVGERARAAGSWTWTAATLRCQKSALDPTDGGAIQCDRPAGHDGPCSGPLCGQGGCRLPFGHDGDHDVPGARPLDPLLDALEVERTGLCGSLRGDGLPCRLPPHDGVEHHNGVHVWFGPKPGQVEAMAAAALGVKRRCTHAAFDNLSCLQLRCKLPSDHDGNHFADRPSVPGVPDFEWGPVDKFGDSLEQGRKKRKKGGRR